MTDQFSKSLQAALSLNAPMGELVGIVRRFKDAGLTQKSAYDALEGLRTRLDESAEGRVLQLMDLVVGWCQPQHRLWEAELET